MMGVITKSWVFTDAQTDFALTIPELDGTHRIGIVWAKAKCANSNTVDVSVRAGLAATTLPAVSNNSATGADGMFFEDGGLPPGGGETNANGGSLLAVGGYNVGPRLTCSVATGGSLRIILAYVILE